MHASEGEGGASAEIAASCHFSSVQESGHSGKLVREVQQGKVESWGSFLFPESTFSEYPPTVGVYPTTAVWCASCGKDGVPAVKSVHL